MNRSLLTDLVRPPSVLDVSVHISLTFSRIMLQWRSKALTRASSLRLLRMEMRTWMRSRTAVWRMERGPAENSCSSSCAISYSLWFVCQLLALLLSALGLSRPPAATGGGGVRRGFLRRSFPRRGEGREVGAYVSSFRDLVRSSLRSL